MMGMGFPGRIRGRAVPACLAVLLVVSLPLQAAETAASPPASSSIFSLLQVLFGLGIVLAAIAATAWLLKRIGPGQTSAASALRVVGGVAVGPRERVVLVDVGDTRLVIGVAPGHVSTLHQMPRPQDDPAGTVAEPLAGAFQDRLRSLIASKGKAVHEE